MRSYSTTSKSASIPASRNASLASAGIIMDLRLLQPRNAELSTYWMAERTYTDSRFSQLSNANLSIAVTLSGISIEVSPRQPRNAHSPIVVTPYGILVVWQPCTRVFEALSIIALQLFLES